MSSNTRQQTESAGEQGLARDHLRRARSEAFQRFLMRRASAAPEAHHWIAFTRSAFRAMRRNCGVLPDYDVRPELSNFAAGRDMVLEFTKALIQEEGARLQLIAAMNASCVLGALVRFLNASEYGLMDASNAKSVYNEAQLGVKEHVFEEDEWYAGT